MSPPPVGPSGLPRPELEALVVGLVEEVAGLKKIVAAQRDEIARLKGQQGRPKIKPSGMEDGPRPKRPGKGDKARRRGKVILRVAPEVEVLRVAHPPGSEFKGYEPYEACAAERNRKGNCPGRRQK